MSTIVGKNVLDVLIITSYNASPAAATVGQGSAADYPNTTVLANTASTGLVLQQVCLENGSTFTRNSNPVYRGGVVKYETGAYKPALSKVAVIDFTGFAPAVSTDYLFSLERKDTRQYEAFKHDYPLRTTAVTMTLASFLASVVKLINSDTNYSEVTAIVDATNTKIIISALPGRSEVNFVAIFGRNFPSGLTQVDSARNFAGSGTFAKVSELEKYYKGYKGVQNQWVPTDYSSPVYYAKLILGNADTTSAIANVGDTVIAITAASTLVVGETVYIGAYSYTVSAIGTAPNTITIGKGIVGVAVPSGTVTQHETGYTTFAITHRHTYRGLSEGNSNAPLLSYLFLDSTSSSTALATLLGTTLSLNTTWRGEP